MGHLTILALEPLICLLFLFLFLSFMMLWTAHSLHSFHADVEDHDVQQCEFSQPNGEESIHWPSQSNWVDKLVEGNAFFGTPQKLYMGLLIALIPIIHHGQLPLYESYYFQGFHEYLLWIT